LIELELTAKDVAHTRFAFSPLWEVVASVWVLKGGVAHDLHRPWSVNALASLKAARLDWRLLADLVPVPTRVIPGFICPPPTTPVPDLTVELSAVCATPAERVRADLDGMREPRSDRLDELYRDPPAGLDRLAAVIEAYWELALAPYWPRILSLLEGDVLYRARLLTEGGADRLFADLSPDVGWDAVSLRLAHRHASGPRSLGGRGLLLVPSVFVWPRIFSVVVPHWQPTLRYPPRGIATLWEQRRTKTPEALAAVLGRSRTLLLAELASPSTTTDLARRTGISAGGVSQHLTALRAAGLVDAHRTGRFVLYARTTVAESLLAAATNR
jgi:DNA-binding transcriptional ArsR family regulator